MYKKILLPVDLAEESSWKKAVPVASELCSCFGAELYVLHVVPSVNSAIAAYLPENSAEKLMDDAEALMRDFMKTRVPDGIKVHGEVAQGETVYKVIRSITDRVGADLVVMASHRPAVSDYLLGPNSARVVRHSDCSVLVVR